MTKRLPRYLFPGRFFGSRLLGSLHAVGRLKKREEKKQSERRDGVLLSAERAPPHARRTL